MTTIDKPLCSDSGVFSSYMAPPFQMGEDPRCIVVTLTGTCVLY